MKANKSLPNEYLTEKHLAFWYKYGFVLIKGLHSQEQIDIAREGANHLLNEHIQAKDGGKGEQAFGSLPEGSRSAWGRCEEPRLMKYFDFPQNKQICEGIIGPFQFKHHHPGPGYYTFAPRFYSWSQNPEVAKNESEEKLVQPFNYQNLPNDLSEWSKQFLKDAAELGIKFAPSYDDNWHIDGIDYNHVMSFSMLWGSYINALPKGNMGNLTIKPGTHHVIAQMLREKGSFFHYDGKKEKPKPLPDLKKIGIADGKSYSLLVDAGDIILAHPLLAHGIGGNMSKEIRLAVYCRLSNPDFYVKRRSQIAGEKLSMDFSKGLPHPKDKKWKGDYWQNVPLLNDWIKNNKDKIREHTDISHIEKLGANKK